MKLEEAGGVLGRGKGWRVELVEDLDLDLDSVSGIVDAPAKPTVVSTDTNIRPVRSETSSHLRQAPSTRPSIPRLPNPAPSIEPIDLLANLHIHERPTPPLHTTPPASVPRPPVISHKPLHETTPGLTPPKKRAPTSIVGEQSKLAQTVLQASKRINPIPQVNPDSEEEGEHEEVEWEREVGLGWGQNEEDEGEAGPSGGDLWESMRAAQEMVNE